MRNIVLTLLLVNILVLAWNQWLADAPTGRTGMEEFPQLVAVGAGSDVAGGEMSLAAIGDSTVLSCVRVGPLAREADAEKIRSALLQQSISVKQSKEQGENWVGHWVQIQELPSRDIAEDALRKLSQGGLSDAYILSTEDGNSISLGVYRQRSSARSISNKAKALGFAADISDRYQPGINYWLNVRLAEGQDLQLGKLRRDVGQILRTEPVVCPGESE